MSAKRDIPRLDAERGRASRETLTPDAFVDRHIGPDARARGRMLRVLGFDSIAAFLDAAVPRSIRAKAPLALGPGRTEAEVLAELKALFARNQLFRSYIGLGYSDCVTPPVILRNILENPGWYTAYTPYQAEIAQGRLEALLNFQTMVADLTGLEVANASLLDEATAAAEAMSLSLQASGPGEDRFFFVSELCHPQTIAVLRVRAEHLGVELVVADHASFDFRRKAFGALLQYPATDGGVHDYRTFCERAHEHGALVTVAADLLGLCLLRPPGEFGADIAVGSTQRFGVPLGYGGPHAAYFATRDAYKRMMPGRIVGVSKDSRGLPALRLALQTREQHIRRERATSNICTAQVLLAVAASMYAVYHGPEGLIRIARRTHRLACALAEGLRRLGLRVAEGPFFDTVRIELSSEKSAEFLAAALARRINLRPLENGGLCVALDETVSPADIDELFGVFSGPRPHGLAAAELADRVSGSIPPELTRTSRFMTHPVFHRHHSETELLRYMRRLEAMDLSLTTSMIPLGSCTMKLNASAEMLPVTWPEVGRMHPFVPPEQAQGYRSLFRRLESWLAEITGFAAVSLMPNAGSQGEYAGLLVLRAYHKHRGQGGRDVCLIPRSAHGTNPASAVLAGLKVIPVACDAQGNIDIGDLAAKAREHRERLAVLMATYPSTHGVFEENIQEVIGLIHGHGGQVYMDGANLNAMVGLSRPGELGADVCHMNLHKTFCIPHGGGGPGMGPIGVARHLAPFLPRHPLIPTGGESGIGPVSAAPWGSASILPISWAYIALMGGEGLTLASEVAILSANYIAKRLEPHYPVLYRGKRGLVAHECILDLRPFKDSADISVEDVAKRLMDYGFHAPTVSWPVPGAMMVEPTESESLPELDRFCEAMISIRREIREIEEGKADRKDNALKNAPHTADGVAATIWTHPYPREKAAYPAPWTLERKFWPSVGRVDNPYGDRNFVCSCPPLQASDENAA